MSTTNTLEAYLPQNLKAWMTSGPAQECRRPVERRIEEPVHLPRPSPEDIELASLPSLQSSASPEMPATPPLPGSPVGAAVAAAVAQAAEQQQVQEQLAAATAARQPDPAPPVYAYCHAFDVAHRSVSILKWAPNGSSMLAWGAADGIVFVATADAPPRLLQVLERHRERVTGIDWSPDGTLLLTCSQDGTACLWRAESGALVRTLRNLTGPLGCCRFLPENPNLLLLGTSAGELLTLNASTGRLLARAELQAAPMAGVGGSCLEPAGDGRLLVADSRGCLHLYTASLQSGELRPLAYFSAARGRYHEPACLQYLPYCQLADGPALLLALSSGEIVLSRLLDKPWRLEVLRDVCTAQASAKVRAALRPGVARKLPELLLVGGEDGAVHMMDIREQQPALVALLEGHSAPVLGVAWSQDERRLASSDKQGVVVVWEAAGSGCQTNEQQQQRQAGRVLGQRLHYRSRSI